MSRALGKSEGDEEDQDLSEKAEATDQNYPGLNKRHGFFRAIERNQVDRDVYHRDQSEWKDQKKRQTAKETIQQLPKAEQEAKDDRHRRRRERQRPDRATYQPPRARMTSQQPIEASPLYKIEIEVKPGVIWKKQVSKAGEAAVLAQSAATKYSLDHTMENAIEDFIQQFEKDLKL